MTDLSQTIARAQARLDELAESIRQLECKTEPILAYYRVKAWVHEDWPELCNCDECTEQREWVSQIQQNVLPSQCAD